MACAWWYLVVIGLGQPGCPLPSCLASLWCCPLYAVVEYDTLNLTNFGFVLSARVEIVTRVMETTLCNPVISSLNVWLVEKTILYGSICLDLSSFKGSFGDICCQQISELDSRSLREACLCRLRLLACGFWGAWTAGKILLIGATSLVELDFRSTNKVR